MENNLESTQNINECGTGGAHPDNERDRNNGKHGILLGNSPGKQRTHPTNSAWVPRCPGHLGTFPSPGNQPAEKDQVLMTRGLRYLGLQLTAPEKQHGTCQQQQERATGNPTDIRTG